MTVYTDDFNRADGGIGNSPIGTAYQGNGTWTIASNQVHAGGGAFATAVFNAGAADADVSIDIKGNPGGDNVGLTLRWTDDNNYWRVVCDNTSTYVQKREAGSFTTPATYGTGATTNKTLRVVLTGNNIETFFDGVSQGTVTNSFNNTATRHGLHSNNTSTTVDNLSVTVTSVVDHSVTDTATVTDAETMAAAILKSVTDDFGADDDPSLNDNNTPWGEYIRASERVFVDKTGGAFSIGKYPYGALVDPSTHTYAKVLSYEDLQGTQTQ